MQNRRMPFSIVLLFVLTTLISRSPLLTQTGVTLAPSTSPAAGQPGVTVMNLIGSGFPSGTILAASTNVRLQPAAGGAAVTTPASVVTAVVGSTRRITFMIPGSVV